MCKCATTLLYIVSQTDCREDLLPSVMLSYRCSIALSKHSGSVVPRILMIEFEIRVQATIWKQTLTECLMPEQDLKICWRTLSCLTMNDTIKWSPQLQVSTMRHATNSRINNGNVKSLGIMMQLKLKCWNQPNHDVSPLVGSSPSPPQGNEYGKLKKGLGWKWECENKFIPDGDTWHLWPCKVIKTDQLVLMQYLTREILDHSSSGSL